MVPSSGHLLVPKALRIVNLAISKTTALIRSKLPITNPTASAAAQPVRVYAKNQPIHPLTFLKQARSQQSRWLSSHARSFASTVTKPHAGLKHDRSKLPISRVSKVLQQRGVAPFASTLRPNLTGGALPRTAGGYSIGGVGKARHFSHTSGCQAQVVNSVNGSVRAFFLGGGKIKYDGIDPLTGEKRFRSISSTQDKAYKSFEHPKSAVRGTNLEFKLSPTITALSPIFSQDKKTEISLRTPELLSTLSRDFALSLRSLSLILNDLESLASFGDLPISLIHTADGAVLSARFPGCDADLVTRLCDEVGVTRGVVREDEAWYQDKEVQMALLFPFAPTDMADTESLHSFEDYFEKTNALEQESRQDRRGWRDMRSPSRQSNQLRDSDGMSFEETTLRSPMLNSCSQSGYESLEGSYDEWSPTSPRSAYRAGSKAADGSGEYEGLEGICKFLQVCDNSRR